MEWPNVTDFCSSLQGQRVRVSDRVTEREKKKTSNTGDIMLVTIREQRYVSEPIEKKYLKF